ncbi:MAG: protein translocase subunit secG [Bacteroidetes bacterium]|nr:protein translocase subunit secG [Bacteroidota bacterium]
MYVFLIILIVIFSLLLTLIVLVQNSKGGGLAAGFQSSNQIMGVRKTTDFLEKATWGLAAAIVVLSIITVGVKSNAPKEVNDSEIKEQSLDLNKQMQQKTATPNTRKEVIRIKYIISVSRLLFDTLFLFYESDFY